MQTILNICDESSGYLQECLTVNKITQANSIKLVSFYLFIIWSNYKEVFFTTKLFAKILDKGAL